MNNYEATLRAIRQVLASCGLNDHEKFIDECIDEWVSSQSTEKFNGGFTKGGKFENFSIASGTFEDDAHLFWTTQLFGGLVSMALQHTRYIKARRELTIDFMRKNFGHPAEVISGVRCRNCGTREICIADIDKYITPSVISRAIVDGLEQDCLEKNTAEILDLSSGYISSERADARVRALNTNVAVSEGRERTTVCRRCGCKELDRCRFLKSLKKPVFVPLSV